MVPAHGRFFNEVTPPDEGQQRQDNDTNGPSPTTPPCQRQDKSRQKTPQTDCPHCSSRPRPGHIVTVSTRCIHTMRLNQGSLPHIPTLYPVPAPPKTIHRHSVFCLLGGEELLPHQTAGTKLLQARILDRTVQL